MIATTTSLAVLAWSGSAFATEGADGPSSVGSPISPYASAASPAWRSNAAYDVNAWGQTAQNADTTPEVAAFNATSMSPQLSSFQSWGHAWGGWSFGSLVAVPNGVTSTPADAVATSWTAHQQVGDIGGGGVALSPIVASYRINQTSRLAFSMGVSVPTVSLRGGRYVYNGANVWGVTPKVAYTKVLSSPDAEASTIVAVGTFSRKSVENYQNGAVGRIEAVVMEKNPNGWGFGGVAAAIQQVYNDPTAMPGRSPNYNNMGGLAMGVGPQVSWSTKWMGSSIDLQYRWIYEFSAPNGHADQPMLLSATLHL
jgi:hypothetical protein